MRLGILSDSHGKVHRVRVAMQLFHRLGVRGIVHCGDVGGMAVFDEFVGHDLRFVWGNMDAPSQELYAYLQTVGIRPPEDVPLRLERAGRTIEVYHGHEPEFARALANPKADYILHGHTHLRRDERIGGARVINPGALHRARVYSVATLDLGQDVVEFHELES